MELQEYRQVITDFLARQNPPVVLSDDDVIWTAVRVAHGQNRGAIWMAALALAMARSYEGPPDHEILQVN
jgi:hypothetical protein